MPTARSQRSGLDRKPLKTVTPERVRTTTVSDLLANGGSGLSEHRTGRASYPA
jgi:hypothetical protein